MEPTINQLIGYKAKLNLEPDLYNNNTFITKYKGHANSFIKNLPYLNNKKALAQQLYNKGNYRGYIKVTTKLLEQKKLANAGYLPVWKNSPPPKPASKPTNKPASANKNTILKVGGDTYTAVGKLGGEKPIKDLVSLFKNIKIGNGIQKVFLRDVGNQFKVVARKNANSTNNVPSVAPERLRLDIFAEMNGKKATIQFFANGSVVITGRGNKSDLDKVHEKLPVIKKIDIIRQSGVFYTYYRIPLAKTNQFVDFCNSKKYFATYTPDLENYISVYAGKMGKKYKHNLKFYYNGQIGYSTANLSECRKIVNELLNGAVKRGLTAAYIFMENKNKPGREKKKTTCANPPNPPDSFEGDCPPGYYCRPNAQGFPCCYKIPENLTVGRATAIAAYKKFGYQIPDKVKKQLFIAFNIIPTNSNRQKNVVFNKNKGLLIRKRGWIRYSVEDLAKFAKPLGIDLAKAKKEREGKRKKLPPGGWKNWLHDQMVKKLAEQNIVAEHVSGSGSNSSRLSYHIASENEPILLQNNNRTHRLTIKPGPPIVISGFIRKNKRRKENEITSRVCTTLDRDVLERIARRVGIKEYKKLSKPQLCSAIYVARRNIVPNYASPAKPVKPAKPVQNMPFRLVQAKPDGNCFYEAFLRGLTGGNIAPTAEQIQKLRTKVKSYYTTEYANRTNNNVVNVNREGKMMSKKQFMNYVVTNKAWAGQAEITAVAHKMKTNIIVLTPTFKVHKQFTVRNPSFQYTVYLTYNAEMSNRGTHFDTLIPTGPVNINKLYSNNKVPNNIFNFSSSSARTNNLAAEMEAAMLENAVFNMPKTP